ncbi:TPA: hypothetical protein QDB45_005295 [Burkholderia vietnamiensis]|nr:hypothetical protein [Burkholderia vietnamiensis]
MAAGKTSRIVRTNALIDAFRGLPDEFTMLKGVLCAPNGWTLDDSKRFNALIDTTSIAARMDALNNAARERMRAELDAMNLDQPGA